MPRPMLKQQQQNQREQNNILSASAPKVETNVKMDKMLKDRMLRKQRSKEYMEAIKKLDAGGYVHNSQNFQEIINVIKSEFPEIELDGILLGFVSRCYLGEPYEVHSLDMTGNIIEHYKKGQSMPGGLEKARGIALRGGYEFIEVYIDCCRAISSSGAVSVIPL